MSRIAQATCHFDVYGLGISVSGWPEIVDNVARDFAWFERHDAHRLDVSITVEERAPDYERFGSLLSSFVTPRNVVYQRDGATIVDYFGRVVSVLDRSTGSLVIQGEDPSIVHEAVYLFVLSRVGEHLDALRLPRLHALGLSAAQGAVAVMLPSGGGKSTLALRALQEDGVRLLSEDSPLLDRSGRLHPFPLRIGINAVDAERLPSQHVRRIERMEFHPKLLLDLAAFADRIDPEPHPLRHLVIGRRSLGEGASLKPLSRSAAVSPLLRELVVGVGIYQGMEFVLQRGMRDVGGKLGVAAMRAACAAAALRQAQVWQLVLGRDGDRSWDALRRVLD
jgi:hypothetical protein